MTKIGVIAGTPIDTQMGVDFIEKAGFDAVSRYCSETPEQQNNMQILDKPGLNRLVVELCRQMSDSGVSGIFMYCNSLASSIDLPAVRRLVPVKIVTPLEVYGVLPQKYKSIAVIAASCHTVAVIENIIKSADENCMVYGFGSLPLVKLIESGMPPDEIIERAGLAQMAESLCKMGGEALLLGCTHFPYIKDRFQEVSRLPVVDPADDMLKMLTSV